jgi:hypothetical protein
LLNDGCCQSRHYVSWICASPCVLFLSYLLSHVLSYLSFLSGAPLFGRDGPRLEGGEPKNQKSLSFRSPIFLFFGASLQCPLSLVSSRDSRDMEEEAESVDGCELSLCFRMRLVNLVRWDREVEIPDRFVVKEYLPDGSLPDSSSAVRILELESLLSLLWLAIYLLSRLLLNILLLRGLSLMVLLRGDFLSLDCLLGLQLRRISFLRDCLLNVLLLKVCFWTLGFFQHNRLLGGGGKHILLADRQ